MTKFKFKILKLLKSFQISISPLHFKTVINDILRKKSNAIVYAIFDKKTDSLTYHKVSITEFNLLYPNYSKKNIYLTEIQQFFKITSKSDLIIPIKVDDLYLSNLNIKKFNNYLVDVLTQDETNHLIFMLSKHLPYQDWINFVLKWNLCQKKYQILDIILSQFKNNDFISHQISLSSNQIKNFNNLIQDILDAFWTPYIEINTQLLFKNTLIVNQWIYDLSLVVLNGNKQKTINSQISSILFNFWKADQKTNDFFYLIRHSNHIQFYETRVLLNKLLALGLLTLPMDKDFNSKEKNFFYSPYFYEFNTIDDYVPYYNIRSHVLLPYCSNSVAYQYFKNLNNTASKFHEFIEILLKKIYKHNVSFYKDSTGHHITEVLNIYEDDLKFLYNFLLSNPEYLMIAFEQISLKEKVFKAECIAKIFKIHSGIYADEKALLNNSLDELSIESLPNNQ